MKRKKFINFIKSKEFNEIFNKNDLLINSNSFLTKENFFNKKLKRKNFNSLNNYNDKVFSLHKFTVFNELNYKIMVYLESRIKKKKENYAIRLNKLFYTKYFKDIIFYKKTRYTNLFNFYDVVKCSSSSKYTNKKFAPYFLNLKLVKRNKLKGKINYVIKKINNSFNYDYILKEEESKFFNPKFFSKYYLPTKNRYKIQNKFFPKMVRKNYFNLSK
jgi:hypothetical protein